MKIDFDVVIDSPENSVDMKSGLETLQGVSEVTRFIAETVLTEQVVKRLNHKSKIRTNLRQNFKGSYGQNYSLDIYDDFLMEKFNSIGGNVFSEIVSYFVNEALYINDGDLSEAAGAVIEGLGVVADDLIDQLRISCLESSHDIAVKFGYAVNLNYRGKDKKTSIAVFDRSTVLALRAEQSREAVPIIASITRLNINTGNGRLSLKEDFDTVAFGFIREYKEIKIEAKKKFSKNLDQNNGVGFDKREYLKLSARPVRLKNGKIIKYIIVGLY